MWFDVWLKKTVAYVSVRVFEERRERERMNVCEREREREEGGFNLQYVCVEKPYKMIG